MRPDDLIATRIDLPYIQRVAEVAARVLSDDNVVVVALTPNDGTVYHIIIVGPHVMKLHEPRESPFIGNHEYAVTLANRFGASYAWGGQRLDSSYVTEKWTRGESVSDPWTGVVLATFLNYLSDAIRRLS